MKWITPFMTTIAPQLICRHAGAAMDQVHLYQNWCHLCPECHLHHLVPLRELKVPKWKVCHPDVCTYILLFPTLNLSILMHMPRITRAKKIVCQIR